MNRPGQGKLFITGTSRSGTTVLADFLRTDQRIVMGRERFAWRLKRPGEFTTSLFEKDRFCLEFSAEDSHHSKHQAYYLNAWHYFESASWIGDKLPRLPQYYDTLYRAFPDCRVVYLARDPIEVADSFQRRSEETARKLSTSGASSRRMWSAERGWAHAITEWNTAVRNTLDRTETNPICVVRYDQLFVDPDALEGLYSFLGLEPTDDTVHRWRAMGRRRSEIEAVRRPSLDEAARGAVHDRADWRNYGLLLSKSTW